MVAGETALEVAVAAVAPAVVKATAVVVMVGEATVEVVTVAGEAGGAERGEVDAALARAVAAGCGSDGGGRQGIPPLTVEDGRVEP